MSESVGNIHPGKPWRWAYWIPCDFPIGKSPTGKSACLLYLHDLRSNSRFPLRCSDLCLDDIVTCSGAIEKDGKYYILTIDPRARSTLRRCLAHCLIPNGQYSHETCRDFPFDQLPLPLLLHQTHEPKNMGPVYFSAEKRNEPAAYLGLIRITKAMCKEMELEILQFPDDFTVHKDWDRHGLGHRKLDIESMCHLGAHSHRFNNADSDLCREIEKPVRQTGRAKKSKKNGPPSRGGGGEEEEIIKTAKRRGLHMDWVEHADGKTWGVIHEEQQIAREKSSEKEESIPIPIPFDEFVAQRREQEIANGCGSWVVMMDDGDCPSSEIGKKKKKGLFGIVLVSFYNTNIEIPRRPERECDPDILYISLRRGTHGFDIIDRSIEALSHEPKHGTGYYD